MAGQFYARWVPPKPVTKTNQSPPIVESQLASSSPDRTKQKKQRKAQRNETQSRENSRATSNFTDTFNERSISPNPSSESHATGNISKKRKRELQPDEQTQQEQDATPKKHKTILSKFERSSKLVKAAKNIIDVEQGDGEEEDQLPEQLHDLVPLPQPAPVPETPFEPTYSTLPTWLAKPITVESSKTVPFSGLGVHQSFQKKLGKQGFNDALAVQSVLLPMLHPGYDQHLGDICVSARTGSGKTLAYLLPIIEALRDQSVTALSAIVVVPTRQLVDQALQVAEDLCAGTKLKVGTALGNVPLATEQKQLVKLRVQYDPARAKELNTIASHFSAVGQNGIWGDLPNIPKDHVPQYESGVDILICTPGRLVEHIESTTGFLLRSVRWLVIDEADQLLTQNFQGWASTLIDSLHSDTPEEFMNNQEQLRRQRSASKWLLALPTRRQITKVVLSATMKKDLTKLGALRLRRPKLVVVEDETEEHPAPTDNDVFELPTTLTEYALPVGDGSNKPLYLLFLLLRHILISEATDAATSVSDSDSDSDSTSSSDADNEAQTSQKCRVLVFAKSNENASRLSHLLSVLEPSLSSSIATMTPSSTAKQSQKLLKDFGAGKIKILIASDTASRGLDIPDITHVINYDIPSSITSYVHRVGRTARAGKDGQAWTLVTKTEAGWFWNQIAKGGNVKRGAKKVSRVEFKERDVTWDRKRTYQEALQSLQGAVEGVDKTTG